MLPLFLSSKRLKISLFFLFFALFFQTKAQTYWHNTLWSRVVVLKQINPKWFVSGEFMLRRQSNYIKSELNFLRNPLGNAERIVIAYRPKNWQFSFAPSRWYAYQLLGKTEDFERKPSPEWRFTPGIELFQPIRKSTLMWRTQYEYRYFSDQSRGRFRQRLQFRFPASKKSDIIIGNEFLWGTPPNSSKRYEQNQLHALWMPRFSKHLEGELGYRWVYRKRRNSDEIDFENAVVASLFVRF